jgi:phage gp29-like protein
MSGLVDQWGNPLRRELLTKEIAGPTITGVRSPISGYPADGLDPVRLAAILREADQGEPLRYFELAEFIEERDLHYAAVLMTRKRSVAQIDATVEAASDAADDVARADMVREWLKRDELADEMFDMLDAVGKGVSFTEIVWDSSEGQWRPDRLEWCDPRHFTFDRKDLRTPLLRGGESGTEQAGALPGFKFIRTQIKAKSGLPARSGLARLAVWPYMFKAFTQRDWAIFTQTYGQPIRVGKFHEGASEADKATLFRAVANIAGDCAAIVPQSMMIEFIEAKNVTAGSDLYEKRSDWLDRQVSKAVLGQTTTTDAISGGHAVSREHRQVQEDIERADCKAFAAALNRDLVRPWMDLEFGPEAMKGRYPRLVIARPDKEDLKQFTDSVNTFVRLGLEVEQSEVRDRLGLSEPSAGAKILRAVAAGTGATHTNRPGEDAPGRDADADADGADLSLHAQGADAAVHPAERIADAMADAAGPAVAEMVAAIGVMVEKAGDLAELREMLAGAYGDIDAGKLADVLAGGLAAAQAAGRSDLADESA